jgi:hypothetical protein
MPTDATKRTREDPERVPCKSRSIVHCSVCGDTFSTYFEHTCSKKPKTGTAKT